MFPFFYVDVGDPVAYIGSWTAYCKKGQLQQCENTLTKSCSILDFIYYPSSLIFHLLSWHLGFKLKWFQPHRLHNSDSHLVYCFKGSVKNRKYTYRQTWKGTSPSGLLWCYSSAPCQEICDITDMQTKPPCNFSLGDCMTNNCCFMKAHKQALQRDFARDLLLHGKEPVPDCTVHFLMALKVFWGLFPVLQGCQVLLALLLCLKDLVSFLAFATMCVLLFHLFLCQNLLSYQKTAKRTGSASSLLVSLAQTYLWAYLSLVNIDRTRGNGLKLKEERFRLDVGGSFLLRGWRGTGTGCPEKWWLPQPWMCSRPGRIGPEQPHLVLDLVVGNPVFGQGAWNCTTFEVPSNPNHAMILWFYFWEVAWFSPQNWNPCCSHFSAVVLLLIPTPTQHW